MGTITLYGITTCDTCRKARKALPQAHFVDVRADGLPDVLRDAALAAFGPQLINTRSTTWRGLDETARAQDPVALLTAHPTLMKRPLIQDDERLYLGWTKTTQAALGL